MELTQASSGLRKVGLPRVQILFHSSFRLTGKEPLFPVMSSPSNGEKKARVLHKRPGKGHVVTFFLWFLASSASSISSLLPVFGREGGVCMVRLFLGTLYPGAAVRGWGPIPWSSCSVHVLGLKTPPGPQRQAGNSVICCRWGKWGSLLYNARIIMV